MSQGPSTSRPGCSILLLDLMAVLKVGGSSRSVTKGYNHLAPVSWDSLGLRANQNRITI
jgi:hypothetical protein